MRISDWSSDVCSSDLELLELTSEHLRFPICDVKIVEHNQRAIFGFGGQSHFQAKRTHLLVQRRIEVTNTRTMRLAATDEDGSATVAVTSGATTLLSTELLAGARPHRATPSRARRSTEIGRPPGGEPGVQHGTI